MIHIAFPGVGEVLAFIVYLRYLQRFLQIDLHDLDRNQLKKRVDICNESISSQRTFDWLDNLITGGEKWVLYVNVMREWDWL